MSPAESLNPMMVAKCWFRDSIIPSTLFADILLWGRAFHPPISIHVFASEWPHFFSPMDFHFVKWVIILTIIIYFDTQVVWDLVIGSPFRLAPLLFRHIHNIFEDTALLWSSSKSCSYMVHVVHPPLSPHCSLFWNPYLGEVGSCD